MKQLSDDYINEMIGEESEFKPDDKHAKAQKNRVRKELGLKPSDFEHTPEEPLEHIRLDLHGMTQDQAWTEVNKAIQSGAKQVQVITGASGTLKIEFKKWITVGILADYIVSWKTLNNGAFEIQIKKQTTNK